MDKACEVLHAIRPKSNLYSLTAGENKRKYWTQTIGCGRKLKRTALQKQKLALLDVAELICKTIGRPGRLKSSKAGNKRRQILKSKGAEIENKRQSRIKQVKQRFQTKASACQNRITMHHNAGRQSTNIDAALAAKRLWNIYAPKINKTGQ